MQKNKKENFANFFSESRSCGLIVNLKNIRKNRLPKSFVPDYFIKTFVT